LGLAVSDPSPIVDGADALKVSGGLGVGGLLMLTLQRLFGGQDKVLAKLDAVQAELGEVRTSLAVVSSGFETMSRQVAVLQEETQRQAISHANLRAVVDGLK